MSRKVSMIYFSATNGTEKIVKKIAEGISDNFNEYNITLPVNREEELTFGANDLLIVGVPVYAGRVPGFLADYFFKIKGNRTPAIFVTVYGNRDYEDALLELKCIFEGNGFIGIAAGAFIGEHSNTSIVGTNRPDIKDLQIAKKFGAEIKNKLDNNNNLLLTELIVKGNIPFKERPKAPLIAPNTSDACTNCGICAKNCPMGAIDFNDFKVVDAQKCIRCCSCIKRCPTNAKSINHEMFTKITQGLIDNFSTLRKEPEHFI